jgi:5-oxopent-3-ene-1,2,5-tricarboxylate decarboxylase/2-hydroxyhepta-2,4-diene-1,7-dioate isomerase
MRIGRFLLDGKVIEGVIKNDYVLYKGKEINLGSLVFLPPCNPSKIIGIVLNYAEHAEELGMKTTEEPVIFIKPNNSLTAHLQDIVYPKNVKYLHYEGELAVVIGKKCRKVKSNEAINYILGYTIANDVTARDFITNFFRPPVKAKGFDTFCPIGPWIVTTDEIGVNPELEIETKVNGEIKQKSNTKMLIHKIPEIIEYLSDFMTLNEGDVILTGTPKGISPLKIGDIVEISVQDIGILKNKVVEEKF